MYALKPPNNQIRVVKDQSVPKGFRENIIFVGLGHMDIVDKKLLIPAEAAKIMYAEENSNQINLGKGYDIGLITIREVESLRHIELPRQ